MRWRGRSNTFRDPDHARPGSGHRPTLPSRSPRLRRRSLPGPHHRRPPARHPPRPGAGGAGEGAGGLPGSPPRPRGHLGPQRHHRPRPGRGPRRRGGPGGPRPDRGLLHPGVRRGGGGDLQPVDGPGPRFAGGGRVRDEHAGDRRGPHLVGRVPDRPGGPRRRRGRRPACRHPHSRPPPLPHLRQGGVRNPPGGEQPRSRDHQRHPRPPR